MSFPSVRLACLAVCLPVLLSAQTIVQSFSFGPPDFTDSGQTNFSHSFSGTVNQFDPALGTLTGITLDFSFTFSGSVTIGAAPGGGGLSTGGSVTWNGDTIDGAGGGSGGGGGPGSVVNLQSTVSFLRSPAGLDFSMATGTGTALLSYDAGVSLSFPGDTTINTFQLDAGSMTLTYAYAAVPEPSTYAALAGFAALGVVIARRRRATA